MIDLDYRSGKVIIITMAMEENEGFKITKDYFGGIEIKTRKQTFESAEEYDAKFAVAIPKWQADGVRGLWVKIDIKQAHVAAVCAKHGLVFNHAQEGYVMMTRWLPTSEPSMIPEYANQYLGVSGFVVNEKNQLLVIQEKYHPGSSKPRWKLPGGHANKGETIEACAKREVFEETGIEAEFISVLSFRHQTEFRYGCADFYFSCLMKPTRPNQEIRLCEQEIGAGQWMEIDEYLSQDLTDLNRFIAQCYKDSLIRGTNLSITCTPVLSWNQKRHNDVFSIQPLKEDK